MKKFNLSLVAVLAMSTFAIAGGDIAPLEPVVSTPMVVEELTSALYLGLSYSWLGHDIDNIYNDTSLGLDYGAAMLQAGYKVNPYIAVEGRYWIGVSKDSSGDNQKDYHHDSDADAWGIYLKPMYPVTNAFDVYALLGYASAEANNPTTVQGNTVTLDADGFSWGVGAEYSFTDNFSVFLDYVAFDDSTFDNSIADLKGKHELDSINLGVTYTF